MTAIIASGAKIPAPLATDADVASSPVGPCSICGRGILRSARYALIFPSGEPAHVWCIARRAMAPGRRAA